MAYRKAALFRAATAVAFIGVQSGTASAADETAAAPTTAVQEVIVTAQKRSQSINSVGESITAVTADNLVKKGIVNTADLVKAVPGFTFTQSPYSTPVYSLRGVGFYEYGLGSTSPVAVYVDEVPLVSSSMGAGATLDLDRVEVLKGPQGTLFGQSSTGGAINYIAAKPTKILEAGGSINYERFGKIDTTGYISGPLTDNLQARVAVRAVDGGAWQQSVTRPNDKLGNQNLLVGRVLLDWEPTDKLTFHVNVNANHDGGDNVAPQLQSYNANIVPSAANQTPLEAAAVAAGYAVANQKLYDINTNPASPAYNSGYVGQLNDVLNRALGLAGATPAQTAAIRAILAEPTITSNSGSVARLAEWAPGTHPDRDNTFYQGALRAEYKVADDVTATSITAYAHQSVNSLTPFTGTVGDDDARLTGFVESFNQELRLSGKTSNLDWLVGVDYDSEITTDHLDYGIYDLSVAGPIGNAARLAAAYTTVSQDSKTYSAFANVDYKITHELSLQAGVRFNKNDRTGYECAADPASDASQTVSFLFGQFVSNPPVNLLPGQCYSVNVTEARPGQPLGRSIVTPFKEVLNQENVPWKFGLTYKFDQGPLLYANVNSGYKAGAITGLSSPNTASWAPAVQEHLMAYEAGFKIPLADHRVEINGAAFYYDYTNQQLRAHVFVPPFGLLEKLTNVPKSYIEGIEGEIVARPIAGLTLSASGDYLKSEVTKGPLNTYNQQGYTGDFAGSQLPFTPKFSGVADADYSFPVGDKLMGALGASLTYHDLSNSTFGTSTILNNQFKLNAYTLLDLRASIAAPNDAWKVTLYGHNVTNALVVNTAFQSIDTNVRQVAEPVTYGVTVSFKLR